MRFRWRCPACPAVGAGYQLHTAGEPAVAPGAFGETAACRSWLNRRHFSVAPINPQTISAQRPDVFLSIGDWVDVDIPGPPESACILARSDLEPEIDLSH